MKQRSLKLIDHQVSEHIGQIISEAHLLLQVDVALKLFFKTISFLISYRFYKVRFQHF